MSGKSSSVFLGILEDISSLRLSVSGTGPESGTSRGSSGEDTTPPFSLPKLSRSPTSILYHRSRMMLSKTSPDKSTNNKKEKLPSKTTNLDAEAEISARLAYLEIIRSLQKENEKLASSEQRAHLDTRTSALTQEYRTLVNQEWSINRRLDDLFNKMRLLRTRLQSLTTQRTEEKKRHAETIQLFSSLANNFRFSPVNTNLAQSSRGVFFSSLLSLSGHLAEYCTGAQGSLLVVERIRQGSSQERDLLWSELGLPSSLFSILLTGNNNFIKVVLVLAQVDQEKRGALLREVNKSKRNIEKINAKFLEDIEKLV